MKGPFRPLLRLAARFGGNRDGATAIEFGLLAVPFFALLGATLEIGLLFFAGQTLETAVERASRLIRTGQAQQQKYDAGMFKAAICDDVSAFMDCGKLAVDVKTVPTFGGIDLSNPMSGGVLDTSKFGYKPGSGGEIVVVRAYYEWPTLINLLGFNLANTAGGAHLIIATDAFRNEPFPW